MPTESNDLALLPESAVRARLGLSRSTWWRLLRAGALPDAVVLGSRRYYRVEVLEAWLAGRTQPARAA
jgi:predicted DNA-binding transcriptional regulator AlpA